MVESRRKIDWVERSGVIRHHFPSVDLLDWSKVFSMDPQFMGQLVNDIIKSEGAIPGKPGKRPGVDPAEAHSLYRELANDSYTNEPFPTAFRTLSGSRSIRHLAATLGINRNLVYSIQTKDYIPPVQVIAQVARGFRKQPEYFLEYRIQAILAFFHNYMTENPDASMLIMRKLQG
jgi:hypothetical protein